MRAFVRTIRGVVATLVLVGCGSRPGSDPGTELLSIEIQPANATIDYTGTPAALDYVAIGTFADGHTEELADAAFYLDTEGALLGELQDATFTATGRGAGKGGVFAQLGELTGATSVIVTVHRTDLGPGVPPDGPTRFPDVSPPGASSPTLVYPLDRAVMPSSVKAPVV